MKLYSAIDLHSNNHVLTVIDEQDKKVFEQRLPNKLEATLEALTPHKDAVCGIAVESTYNWYWLVDGLMEAGYTVHLVNTTAVQPFSTCTETLYRLIYSAPGQNKGWPGLLSLARPRRTPIRAKKRIRYLNFRNISERPQAATERLEFGHWEGDSVHFTESKNERHVTTLIERKSRYALGILQPSTRSNVVMTRIKKEFHDQPLPACKSLTLDQGTEFSYFQILERAPRYGRRKIKTYYCNPKSPWQKGGVENFNLRLRRFLPRGFNIQQLTAAKLNQIIRTMNRTPRKCLGFKTPQEVYTDECRAWQ